MGDRSSLPRDGRGTLILTRIYRRKVAYPYDKNGNRLCKWETGTSTSYNYFANTNRRQGSTGGEAASFNYDKNANLTEVRYPRIGSMTREGKAVYRYDAAGRVDLLETSVLTLPHVLSLSNSVPGRSLAFQPGSNSPIHSCCRSRLRKWRLSY